MKKSEIKEIAIKELNSYPVYNFREHLCNRFINPNDEKDCINTFNKNFIQYFIQTYQNEPKDL
jgi:hypothetical protein